MQRELDAANERFKEFERRDVKLREDLKHLKARRKKLAERALREGAKQTVRESTSYVSAKLCESVCGPWLPCTGSCELLEAPPHSVLLRVCRRWRRRQQRRRRPRRSWPPKLRRSRASCNRLSRRA